MTPQKKSRVTIWKIFGTFFEEWTNISRKESNGERSDLLKEGKVNWVGKIDFTYNITHFVTGSEDKHKSIIPVDSLHSK